ncbi:MAG: hypothetical protein LBQ73_02260 [Tannerellaceae bacterium]|jgi:hypothetical protein|nr:hypothetical protein [Tannerellaceae bacterium]
MKGSCIMDGIDIADWGMFIVRGGDYDFLSFPERKEPPSTNWYEHNGIDADLSEVYFKEKKISVKFYISARTGMELYSNINTFFSFVSEPGYRQIYVREFDRTFRLRYLSCPELKHKGGLVKVGNKSSLFTVEFAMDDPLQLFTNPDAAPTPPDGYFGETHVSLNERDLSEYGIIVNECYNTILPLPAVKKPLSRDFSRINGVLVYPYSKTNFEIKQAVIGCTMRAASREEFYTNYEALFRDLTAPGELTLASAAGEEKCFFAAMDNFKKNAPFRRRILVSFDLRLTCIDSGEIDFLLSTEDNALLVTEDDINFIDTRYYGQHS